MKSGKKYRSFSEKIERAKKYPMEEAVKLIKENKIAKFDEAVEMHIHLAIDVKKGDQMVRGTIVLPHSVGGSKKIAVITTTKAKDAKEAGADFVYGEELIEKIKSGKFEAFDILVATPEMMPRLAPIAKILGPKGLMPSPKTETVTDKIKEAIGMLKKGKSSFKNDDTGNIHQVIGKISFTEEQIKENVQAFLEVIRKSKPETLKGKYIVSITLCSTMGPGIKVNI
jgi:large subunit ribosomal protein L1